MAGKGRHQYSEEKKESAEGGGGGRKRRALCWKIPSAALYSADENPNSKE